MAVLSKTVIESIAEKMTEKSRKYADSVNNELKELVTAIYEDQLPAAVKNLFKTHSEYLETTQSVFLDGNGFNREVITMTKRLPSTTSYNQKLSLTAAIADKIMKAKRKKEKADEDYRQLVQETGSALYALKTYKNIKENLPEAIPFLPPPMSNALVVNFAGLQKKLGKQPQIKAEVAK